MFSALCRLHAPRRAIGVAVRHFSDAHDPPVKLFGLTARYANAAYSAASKEGSLDQVETEIEAIGNVIKSNAAFASTLANPTVGRDAKVAYLDSILGDRMSSVTKNLLLTMASNARLDELQKVTENFGDLMKAKKGIVDATVTSAAKLTKAQQTAIRKALEGTLESSQKIQMNTKVDPKLLGGLQVQIGDKYMDLSVASKIERVKRALLDVKTIIASVAYAGGAVT